MPPPSNSSRGRSAAGRISLRRKAWAWRVKSSPAEMKAARPPASSASCSSRGRFTSLPTPIAKKRTPWAAPPGGAAARCAPAARSCRRTAAPGPAAAAGRGISRRSRARACSGCRRSPAATRGTRAPPSCWPPRRLRDGRKRLRVDVESEDFETVLLGQAVDEGAQRAARLQKLAVLAHAARDVEQEEVIGRRAGLPGMGAGQLVAGGQGQLEKPSSPSGFEVIRSRPVRPRSAL